MTRNIDWMSLMRGCLLLYVLTSAKTATAAEVDQRGEELFAHRVLKIFQDKCFACHGNDGDDLRGGLNMLSRGGLLRGGESGDPSIVPGQPEESPLIAAIRWESYEMPPKENDRLTPQQIADVTQWVAAGAPWPTSERLQQLRDNPSDEWNQPAGVRVATSGGLSADWTSRQYDPEQLWAYKPLPLLQEITVPAAGHPVDAYLNSELERRQLAAAAVTDRATLLRRATFDLTGLPPTAEDAAAFLADARNDSVAFQIVVDRLLSSPHYGEQWGRHWLDVVRYADSSGFANDYERGNAWRYRDYVVRAFNADKPYDQFVLEQIAGDELALELGSGCSQERAAELIVATGFLRMGPWELTGMEVAKVARQRFLDDVTDTVGQVFLGHMLQCARCHDHKFDPVPTRDYYAMQAAFATTQIADRHAEFLATENTSNFGERKYLEQRAAHYRELANAVDAKVTLDAARQWLRENDIDPTVFEEVVTKLSARPQPVTNREVQGAGKKTQPVSVADVRKELQRQNVDPATIPPKSVGFEPVDFGIERIARKGLQRLQWQRDRYEPYALAVYSGKTPQLKAIYEPFRMPKTPLDTGVLEATAILTGGDPFSPQASVSPGVLSVVDFAMIDGEVANVTHANDSSPSPTTDLPTEIVGRRLALARWIVDERNPLTARVIANRVWQWHFGKPLAGNPNNFGATGKKPSHPELLDFLAAYLIDNDWSLNALHRLIMSSEAYRRDTQHPDEEQLRQADPENITFAVFHPRRLDAEELRDAMLFASGEINLEVGGIPVRPEMNLEAALQPRMVMGTFAEAWQPSPTPGERHRRSLYALRLRGQRDPFFEVFNAPNPDLACEAREVSTITPQVFSLFNSQVTYDRAIAIAQRSVDQAKLENRDQPERQLELLYRFAFGRVPTAEEAALCLAHWGSMTQRHRTLKFSPPEIPREVVRNAVEENTGEKFQFVEPLEVAADFVPDLKPHEVTAEVRAWAEVALVLFNSNEFAYLY